ncbi:MAG: hypothetical protein LBK40_06110 [Spirochaetaceae bacterium]|nr:hypothetical protein [Spirochaetaceae bacterium]
MGDMRKTREPVRGLTFEDVWAMFQETDRKMQETDRKIKEMTARTDKQIGELGNRFGELAEHLVRPNVLEKFRALGYTFSRAGSDVEFFDRAGKALTEVDIWLENGEFVMVVEIKSRLRKRDVGEHIRRMEILRAYLDERNDRRKLLGAVAAVVVTGDMRKYVPEKGFYLIEPSGDTVRIAAPEGFTPKVW